jgi:hypothetical protein
MPQYATGNHKPSDFFCMNVPFSPGSTGFSAVAASSFWSAAQERSAMVQRKVCAQALCNALKISLVLRNDIK